MGNEKSSSPITIPSQTKNNPDLTLFPLQNNLGHNKPQMTAEVWITMTYQDLLPQLPYPYSEEDNLNHPLQPPSQPQNGTDEGQRSALVSVSRPISTAMVMLLSNIAMLMLNFIFLLDQPVWKA